MSRTSAAALAVIRRPGPDGPLYLAQFNAKWNAFSSVGGHRKDGEAFRRCLVREIAEELRLAAPPDDPDAIALDKAPRCRVAASPLGVLRYRDFSQSANALTDYEIALFAAHLDADAVALVSKDKENAWLSERDIDSGKAPDGRPVSPTMRRHLDWLRGRAAVPVVWLIAPENRLREAMSEDIAGKGEAAFRDECAFVADALRRIFPAARLLAIRDRLEGFRRVARPHKLLVEVVPDPADDDRADLGPDILGCREVYLVKVGDPDELEKEWLGWRDCRPPGQDSILSSLRAVRDGDELVGLVYGDATNSIGGAAVSLEQAVRECCLHGKPSLSSVCATLRHLYARLGERFYRRSWVPDVLQHLGGVPTAVRRGKGDKTLLRERLEEAVALFGHGGPAEPGGLTDGERRRLRREALALLASGHAPDFLDPIDYLRRVLAEPSLAPSLLVGAAHGDLHGRNVIVGKLTDEVGSVAVFDYGDMHLANHVGWDFAKMETELKVRAYTDLFSPRRRKFIQEVAAFERRLDARSLAAHHAGGNDPGEEADEKAERLAQVLLEVRRLAGVHLGTQRHRPHLWRDEYHFLLACYGSYALKFPTYQPHEFLAAYVSAGTAALAVGHVRRDLRQGIHEAREKAIGVLDKGATGADTLKEAARGWFAEKRLFGHHARLSFLREWVGRLEPRRDGLAKATEDLLRELAESNRHALEVREVLLLALAHRQGPEAMRAELDELYRDHVELPHEIECRLGRRLRERALKAWAGDGPPPAAAVGDLEESLRAYRGSWDRTGHYYPGVNAAGLLLITGRAEESRELAEKVLAAARREPGDPWADVSQADMLFLLGRDDEAASRYETALAVLGPRDRQSCRGQMELLLRVAPARRAFWDASRLAALFDEKARSPEAGRAS